MDITQQILSEITVYNKYAKYLPEFKRRETWNEIVTRNKEMHQQKFPSLFNEIEDVYKLVYDKKILPSMRSMQFAGKPIEINNARIFNCSFAPIDDWRVFSEVMFLLLGGCGVGYSVQNHHVDQLPEIIKPIKEKRFLVGDSIEGWADAIKILMKSYLVGGPRPKFDFRDVRPKGAMLITAGGKAPGPEPLKECLFQIQKILDRKETGDKLKPIECHDIICYIADAVLSGGIRRAALISLFSFNDEEMLTSKFGNWWEQNPQRGRANNSATILRDRIQKEEFMDLWKKIELSNAGEPGFFLTNDKDWGTNPCVTGDTLVKVKDHGAMENGTMISEGLEYEIPMKHLVELYETSSYPPMVLSYNTEKSILEWDYLDMAAMTRQSANVIELELDNGKTIKLTPDHKIYTENRGWIEAAQLSEDDELIFID